MKSIDELKKEQYDLKAKLHEMIEFINGDDYFSLSPREKGLVGQQRVGMEMYLNALTSRIYSKEEYSLDSSSLFTLPLITSMFTNSCWSGTSSNIDYLKKELDKAELKESNIEEDESGCSD